MYASYPLQLSAGQLQKLARGQRIRLKHTQLGSLSEDSQDVPLTVAQVRKCEKAKAAGKGCDLQLTVPQIEGGGLADIFKSLPGRLKSVAKTVGNKGIDLAGMLADKGVDAAFDLGAKVLADKLDGLAGDGSAGKAGQWALAKGETWGRKYTKDQLAGLLTGLKSSVNGKGLFTMTKVGRGLAEGAGLHPPGRGNGLRLPGE